MIDKTLTKDGNAVKTTKDVCQWEVGPEAYGRTLVCLTRRGSDYQSRNPAFPFAIRDMWHGTEA